MQMHQFVVIVKRIIVSSRVVNKLKNIYNIHFQAIIKVLYRPQTVLMMDMFSIGISMKLAFFKVTAFYGTVY